MQGFYMQLRSTCTLSVLSAKIKLIWEISANSPYIFRTANVQIPSATHTEIMKAMNSELI